MAFNFDEIVIDRVLRVHKFDFDGKRNYTASQIRDPNLECGGETVYSTDAVGVNIMAFDRSKTATFSFSNALLHFGMAASQLGAEKKVASESAKQVVTCIEFLKVDTTSGAKVTLAHTPYAEVESIPFSYIDKIDPVTKVTVATYEIGETEASEFSVSGATVTLPTGGNWTASDIVVVKYKYETTEGIVIENSAEVFAKPGEFVVEAICYNPCDKGNKKLLNVIFPNAKEDNNISLTLTNELTHPVTITALQDYCSSNKSLFRIEAVA